MKRSGFQEMSPYRYPFYTILHPRDGFQEMKFNKKGSMTVMLMILAAWLFVELFYRSAMAFDMNPFIYQDVSLLRVAVITIIMYVMVCLSNWCFCTLLDGKGKLKDICIVASYSLLPYIIVRFVTVLLSVVMTGEEQMILDYLVILSQVWCFAMAYTGLQEIHEYSFKKTLMSIVLTLVGVVIMFFISILLIMLLQQLYNFIVTVTFELRY
ncbi:MAG: YIP1 family protein [Lachnospiraceae bacterium]|nr:YIP1 family protein [Lachnospiraceae bacterium]